MDSAYGSIFESTRLLIFFATPHRGGKHATVGDIAAKILTSIFGISANDLVSALKSNSDEVTRRITESRHIFEGQQQIVSFFESEPYGKAGIVCTQPCKSRAGASFANFFRLSRRIQQLWVSQERSRLRCNCQGTTVPFASLGPRTALGVG